MTVDTRERGAVISLAEPRLWRGRERWASAQDVASHFGVTTRTGPAVESSTTEDLDTRTSELEGLDVESMVADHEDRLSYAESRLDTACSELLLNADSSCC